MTGPFVACFAHWGLSIIHILPRQNFHSGWLENLSKSNPQQVKLEKALRLCMPRHKRASALLDCIRAYYTVAEQLR